MIKSFQPPVMLYLAVSLIMNILAYNGTRLFTSERHHFDMTTAADTAIPFLPCTITIYLGCYIFWVINYYLGCVQDLEEAKHFLCADFFAKTICCVIYIVFPTTNIRPEITGTGLFDTAMKWLYRIDPADNLFPSIHCLTSWFCVIAVRKQDTIPYWYKILSVLLAFAVFISTLTTGQHVIADVIAGVFLAEFSYIFVKRNGFLRFYDELLKRCSQYAERRRSADG